MPKYAKQTEVASDRSRAEIERTLDRYGATGFVYGRTAVEAVIAFEMGERRVMFRLPMPDTDSDEFTLTDTGRERSDTAARKAYEQATRQRWRALALVIKAKLEAVESGITGFDEEFLAHLVLPNGQTVGARMLPELQTALSGGDLPPLLPDLR